MDFIVKTANHEIYVEATEKKASENHDKRIGLYFESLEKMKEEAR